ncbi:MAG: hypothetical protein ACKO96_11845, partial [Flammeovirgaceae bacterium]
PVPLSQEDSSRLFFQSQRIKHHLDNLLSNTKEEKIVGELVLAVTMASNNKESHQLSESARDQQCEILQHIINKLGFKLGTEKAKVSPKEAPLVVVNRPPQRPILKWIPNRVMV